MSRTVIRHGMVLTLDDASTYFELGRIIVEGDRITAVEPESAPFTALPDDRVIDATDKLVMPGLVPARPGDDEAARPK